MEEGKGLYEPVQAQPRSVSEPVRGETLDGGIHEDYQGSETGEVQFSCQIY